MSAARDYWYAVAVAAEVKDQPAAVELLGERIVLYRAAGEVAALQDLCIHRGSPLSMGRVEDDTLVCGYHGWRYAADGACVAIPQRPPEHGIPARARVERFHCEERYGLVWVCVGEPKLPIPEYPEAVDTSFRTVFTGREEWQAGAARMMENFLDTGHFAWVHAGLLGQPDHPELDASRPEVFEDGFEFTVATEVQDAKTGEWTRAPVRMRYYTPYTVRIIREREEDGEHLHQATLITVQPISHHRSGRYTFFSRNFNLDETADDEYLRFLELLRQQDRAIVEAQRPEELPLDLAEEMHIAGMDWAAIEFRRVLARAGIDESAKISR